MRVRERMRALDCVDAHGSIALEPEGEDRHRCPKARSNMARKQISVRVRMRALNCVEMRGSVALQPEGEERHNA